MWQMLECAGVMAECAAVCALDIDNPDCIECMGDLYDECKDCFSTIEAIEKQAGKLQEVHSLHVAFPNKCITMSVLEKLENTGSCSVTKIGASFQTLTFTFQLYL